MIINDKLGVLILKSNAIIKRGKLEISSILIHTYRY